jgi:predicted nucleic acid-binding protein
VGLTVLDADVLIGVLNRDDAQHRKARRLIVDVLTEVPERAISAMTMAEVMVGPMARGDAAGEKARLFIQGLRAEIVPLDEAGARLAASIRVRTGVKMPDACVLATAMQMRGRHPGPVTIASFDKRLLRAWRAVEAG